MLVKFLSLNVNHKLPNHTQRLEELLSIIRRENPEVVCLQEVSRAIIDKLVKEMKCMNYYVLFPDEIKVKDNFEMMFSRFEIIRSEYFKFRRTSQNRGFIRGLLKINDDNNIPHILEVITSQMESADASIGVKKLQIEQVTTLPMKDIPYNCTGNIFIGDTGIAEHTRHIKQPDDWIDAWYECGNTKNMYTIDYMNNLIAPAGYRERPDRAWVKGGVVTEFHLFQGDNAAISTHFGLIVTVDFGTD